MHDGRVVAREHVAERLAQHDRALVLGRIDHRVVLEQAASSTRCAAPRGRGAAPYAEALACEDSPEALEGLSWAAWWLDDVDACFELRERAYRS